MHPDSHFDGVVRLADWGVIRARGADTAAFLHGQLTVDIMHLGTAQARLAGYCSAKGRLLASFVVWRASDDELLLACSADLLGPTLQRLRMFVLRAKCTLSDASAELPLFGLVGAGATRWLGDAAPTAVWGRRERDGFAAIRLPDAAGCVRYLAAGPLLSVPLAALDAEAWRWLEVSSGVARIERAVVERFVPQMLNFELLGGVDFKKGCYPGQEIVARSQYRGTVKRRSLLFACEGPAAAGQDVFHSGDPGQPAGTVVNAAMRAGGSGGLALVEIKLAALANGSVHLGTPDGPRLSPVDQPYAIAEDASAAV